MSEAVHRGPTDQHHEARGQAYSHDADTGDEAPAIQQQARMACGDADFSASLRNDN